ncbi:MAG: DUF1501 domain-containing protein [Planctomycetota bacterium]
MSSIRRRDFLKASGLAAFSFPFPLVSLGGFQKRAGKPVLVVLYLRGGMDPLNVVVPYGHSRYYAIRPTIAIQPKATADEKGVLVLNKKLGLHPALAPIEPLYRSKMFAPVLGVGSPHPTRSHFDAQDFMEYAAPGNRTLRQGWLNRYLSLSASDKDSELRAVALQNLLPRALRGEYPVLAVGPERRRDKTDQLLDLFDELYGKDGGPDPQGGDARRVAKGRAKRMERNEDPVLASGRATIKSLRRFREIQRREGRRSQVRYPTRGLGPKLQGIARVIKSGEDIQVAGADWNGWDHHTGEGAEDGRMAQMLGNLAGSIAAFYQDIGPDAERTVLLTMSEFGRTCRENGNRGTDHGHGGIMLAFGGPVRGGRILGRFEGLEDKDLYQGRDLPVSTDFRNVFNEILVKHMGFKTPRGFFPDYKPGKGIGLIG